MKGWHLFRHSLSMISTDVVGAFRVTGLPYAVIVAITLLGPGLAGGAGDPSRVGAVALLALPAYVAALLWLAVQWHRYVLTGEVQAGAVPFWHGRRILSYLGRSILLSLVAVPVFFALFVPVGFVSAAFPDPAVVVAANALAATAGIAILGRFSPVLPAAALGEPLSLGQAWRATSGATGAILVMSVLLGLLSAVPLVLALLGLGVIAAVSNLAFQWLLTVLGVSVMTTLYGHYVEGRELT